METYNFVTDFWGSDCVNVYIFPSFPGGSKTLIETCFFWSGFLAVFKMQRFCDDLIRAREIVPEEQKCIFGGTADVRSAQRATCINPFFH